VTDTSKGNIFHNQITGRYIKASILGSVFRGRYDYSILIADDGKVAFHLGAHLELAVGQVDSLGTFADSVSDALALFQVDDGSFLAILERGGVLTVHVGEISLTAVASGFDSGNSSASHA